MDTLSSYLLNIYIYAHILVLWSTLTKKKKASSFCGWQLMPRFTSGQRAEKVTVAYTGHWYHSLRGLGSIIKEGSNECKSGKMWRDAVKWCLWVTASMIVAATVTETGSRLGLSTFHHGYRRGFRASLFLEGPLIVNDYGEGGVIFFSGVTTYKLPMLQ